MPSGVRPESSGSSWGLFGIVTIIATGLAAVKYPRLLNYFFRTNSRTKPVHATRITNAFDATQKREEQVLAQLRVRTAGCVVVDGLGIQAEQIELVSQLQQAGYQVKIFLMSDEALQQNNKLVVYSEEERRAQATALAGVTEVFVGDYRLTDQDISQHGIEVVAVSDTISAQERQGLYQAVVQSDAVELIHVELRSVRAGQHAQKVIAAETRQIHQFIDLFLAQDMFASLSARIDSPEARQSLQSDIVAYVTENSRRANDVELVKERLLQIETKSEQVARQRKQRHSV